MKVFQLHQVNYIYSNRALEPIGEGVCGLFATIRAAEKEIEARENTKIKPRGKISEANKHYNISPTKSYYISEVTVKE